MRKGQEKILQKAEKHHFSAEYMEYLQREDLTIHALEFAYQILFNYKDSGYHLSGLKTLLSDMKCQDYFCPILNVLNHDKKPSPEDILFVVHDNEIDSHLMAYAIQLLGIGWSVTDIHRIFTQYADILNQAFEQNTDKIDKGAVRFFAIITDAIYYENGRENLSLREKYANISLTDEHITSSVRFAMKRNIQPEEFKQYEYNPMKYILGHIPYLSVLSENLSSEKHEDFQYEITNLEQLKKLTDIAGDEHGIAITKNPVNAMKVYIATESINIHLWHYTGAYYNPDQEE